MSFKKIVFIPPEGVLVPQDFALIRVAKYFKSQGVETYLLQINEKDEDNNNLFIDYVINVKNKEELFKYLKENKFELIFHRAWMHRYQFASDITKEFSNAVVYIKDWHDGTRKEQYKFVYKTDSDYKGIEELFKSDSTILSHFASKQVKIWKKKYNIKKDNFLFFPEYCDPSSFEKNNMSYNNKEIKLVYAGGVPSTISPEDIVPAKQLFRMIKTITLTKQAFVDLVLLPKFYNNVFNTKELYQDYLYENKFNNYFNIRKGEELGSHLLSEYDFGFFADSYIEEETLYTMFYKYAVTSKLAFYLEAGLPILVNQKSKALCKIVKKYKIGLIYKDEDLMNLQKIINIKKNEYLVLVNNVYKFREEFTYNNKTMKPILEMMK